MSYVEKIDSVITDDQTILYRMMLTMLQSLQVVDTTGRQRVVLDAGTTVVTQPTAANLNATISIAAAQTLAALTTLGNITNIGGLNAVMQIIDTANIAFQTGMRPNLVVT